MSNGAYWIDVPMKGRLALMGRPRAGDWLMDEISRLKAEGADVVVSLLENDEVRELELGQESELCRQAGVRFVHFPIPDRGVPSSSSETAELARALCAQVSDGEAVVIHCRAGIGRSALMAGCVLSCAGVEPAVALDLISTARQLRVPDTDAQIRWLRDFHDAEKARSKGIE
jgi:protein-tyrosine phosphatase